MGKGRAKGYMDKRNLLITLRELTSADIAAVRDITWRTWLATYSRFIPEDDLRSHFDKHYSTEALTEFFSAPDNSGCFAQADGAAAGYCRTHFDRQEGRFYIPSLYILPGHQHAGLGTLLLERAEGFAKMYGVYEAWLGVMVENTDALTWYRNKGYQFVQEAPFPMGATIVAHLIGFKRIIRSCLN
jgi:ribosomal protein S18 acetylase RimI-like enzyme